MARRRSAPLCPPVELSEKRRAPLCHSRRGDVPCANNATERATGRSEITRKTVRGRKSEYWTLNRFPLTLTRRAWSGEDGLELSGLVTTRRHSPGKLRPPKPAKDFQPLLCMVAFAVQRAVGGTFAIRYEIFRRAPDAAPDMLIRLAAVPAVAALLAYLDKRASGEGVDALCEFLSKIRKNGGGEKRRPRNEKRRAAKPLPKVITPRRRR